MPIAVISGASLGRFAAACRRSRSIADVERGAEGHRREQRESTSGAVTYHAWLPSSPNQDAGTVTQTIVPHMNTSPWAKLISSMMP